MLRLRRRWQYGTNSLVTVLLVAALLVLVNLLAARRFARLDLTEGREFTLAPASRKVVGNLDDLLTVSVYFSEKLPPYLVNLRAAVRDLLDEYRAFSKGKLQVKFIDPARDAETEKLVRQLGIQQVQMNVIEKDEQQIINGYLGIALYYEDRKEAIPVVANLRNLEYDLTAAMLKVQRREVRTIGFLSTKAAQALFEDYAASRRALAKQYRVTPVEVADGKEVPKEITVLVLPGSSGLTPREKFAIDQYIMRGGRTLWLVDTVKLEEGLRASLVNNVAEDLLRVYGLRVGKQLILDRSNAPATFNSGIVRFSLPYPFWVKVAKANLSSSHPITNRLESLVLPWASAVEVVAPPEANLKVTELARTTPYAWAAGPPFNLNPQQRFQVKPEARRAFPLAVAVTGRFTSLFKGKEAPPRDSGKEGETQAEGVGAEVAPKVIEESPETSLLIMGDSDFIADRYLGAFPHNLLFFQNAIDWLAQGEELIGIRSRGATERPLEKLGEPGKATARWLATLAMPILVVGFGLVRFGLRRRMRRVLADLQG